MSKKFRSPLTHLTGFARTRNANVAIIFALSVIPNTAAADGGLDLARGMVVRTNMAEAPDAAALAVGSANTNQTTGLDHGMMMQASSTPYSALTPPSNSSQYIILLTDSVNTQNRWSTSQSLVDARMARACTDAKAAGLIIYTIFLDIGGTSGNSTVLQNCATDSIKYYDLTTTGPVATTFNQIAQQITDLRVNK